MQLRGKLMQILVNFSVVFESQIPNSTLRRRMFMINTTTYFHQCVIWAKFSQILSVYFGWRVFFFNFFNNSRSLTDRILHQVAWETAQCKSCLGGGAPGDGEQLGPGVNLLSEAHWLSEIFRPNTSAAAALCFAFLMNILILFFQLSRKNPKSILTVAIWPFL